MQITPLTAYAIEVQSTIDGGSGLAGATFYTGAGQRLSAQGIRLVSSGGGTQGGTLVAPPGSYFVALWVGNWQDGGTLQVCLLCIFVTWHHFDMSNPPLWSVAHRAEMVLGSSCKVQRLMLYLQAQFLLKQTTRCHDPTVVYRSQCHC